MLGEMRAELRVLLIWALVEYFSPMETKYLPALWGKWYLLQTNKHNL